MKIQDGISMVLEKYFTQKMPVKTGPYSLKKREPSLGVLLLLIV
jgi:hypothetical protein